jgi:predicted nucleic acid-binding protein
MVYLHSNVLIYPIIYGDTIFQAAKARVILACVEKVFVDASTLTWDELVWVVRKTLGSKGAAGKGKMLLQFPKLKFIEVGESALLKAQRLLEKYDLKQRDAIYASVALSKNLTMISDDTDFDVVKELKRKSIRQLADKLLEKHKKQLQKFSHVII